jgi:hypothetical protein
MSLQVGFSTHSKDLQSAYEQVINSNSPVNWLIYTYDKGTNDLKVQATGEDGLEELSEEFIDGRIQYALARVTDPNTELPKLVFIAWVNIVCTFNVGAFSCLTVLFGSAVWNRCPRIQKRLV